MRLEAAIAQPAVCEDENAIRAKDTVGDSDEPSLETLAQADCGAQDVVDCREDVPACRWEDGVFLSFSSHFSVGSTDRFREP